MKRINIKKGSTVIPDHVIDDVIFKKWLKKDSFPNLILSVTGGAQNFTLGHDVKLAFKQGLVKAAKATSAWIISGGTNYGKF